MQPLLLCYVPFLALGKHNLRFSNSSEGELALVLTEMYFH